jgi:hypothetical protein
LRSRSPSAQPRRPSLSRNWVEVVCHSSLRAAVPPRPSPRCCEESNETASLDSVFRSQFALMRMELIQLVDVRVEEVSRPLREEVATLKLLLARVSVPLDLTEECTSADPGLVSAQALFPLDSIDELKQSHELTRVKSSRVGDQICYANKPIRGSNSLSSSTESSYYWREASKFL